MFFIIKRSKCFVIINVKGLIIFRLHNVFNGYYMKGNMFYELAWDFFNEFLLTK